jgi:hypothetical protein
MADRVYWYTNVIPALTHIATPITFPMAFNAANVEQIDIIVPPGPAGSVGFQIVYGGGSFLPQSPGQYIVADNYVFTFSQSKAPDGGNYAFKAYNEDIIPHTIQVAFQVNDFTQSTIPSTALVGL